MVGDSDVRVGYDVVTRRQRGGRRTKPAKRTADSKWSKYCDAKSNLLADDNATWLAEIYSQGKERLQTRSHVGTIKEKEEKETENPYQTGIGPPICTCHQCRLTN